jgi:hypothetical protein
MKIEDGKGSGRQAQVDDDHRLVTTAITKSNLEHINAEHKRAWQCPLDAVVVSGANWFFFLRNDSDIDMMIPLIRCSSATAGIIRLSKVTGTPVGGTTIAANSMNLSSTFQPEMTIQTGADITGLTEAGLLIPIYQASNTWTYLDMQTRIIIAPGTAIGLKAGSACTINGNVLLVDGSL